MTTSTNTRAMVGVISGIENKRITFDSYLQRKVGQWSPLQKSKLIDSILRGYPVPPVYVITTSGEEISVIDGCQRLNTVSQYVNNRFSLSAETASITVGGKEEVLRKKKFKSLPKNLQEKITNSEIVFVKIEDFTDDELIEIFDRLNGGTPLSTAQKNKVYMGFEFANQIVDIARNKLFEKTGISATQIKRDEDQAVVVQALMLITPEYASSGFSKSEVTKFLKNHQNVSNPAIISKLNDMFTALDAIIPEKNKSLKKTMIAPILKAIEPIYQDKAKMAAFKSELEKFLADTTKFPAYTNHASLHTTAAEHVAGRVEFFRSMIK